tara:strand:- start:951 stop:1706 length:756 start_codon:yes stop_codon:yes gene_type:complete
VAVRILRFVGGSGGDNILQQALHSDTSLESNTEFEGLTGEGKIQDDTVTLENRLPNMEQIYSLGNHTYDTLDTKKLEEEIHALKQQDSNMIIKSHLFTDKFDDITIDLLPSIKTLPWAVHRNYHKTETANTHHIPFNIPDAEVKKRFIIYQIAQNLKIIMNSSRTRKVIYIDDLFKSFKEFKQICNEFGIPINSHCEKQHKKWCDKNRTSVVPSNSYMDMVNSDKVNYNDPGLSLSEKYSLMAIKGGFKIV